jgi:solute:Na+ symporter, SSS family
MDTVVLNLSLADWLIVAAYLVVLLFLGLRGSRLHASSSTDFMIGGRMLTLPGFVAALVTTWYGGILGVGEFSYMYGLANWVVFGAPYYVFALLFAVVFARRVRDSGLSTIPEVLYQRYDRKTGLLGSVLVFFNSSPAPYLLMLAVLIQVVTGWPLLFCIVVGSVVSVVYVVLGGFRSVVRIDKLQFVMMFVGFFMLLAWLIPEYGFLGFLTGTLPPMHLTLSGGHDIQYIVVWFFIALWTLVSPQFHQFTLSARNPSTARRGIVLSVLCWFLLDGITTLSGLYARALLPELAQPTMAYPLLADAVLPSVAKALFFLGMFATVMSTNDGLMFISALTVGRDVLSTLTGRSDDASLKRFVRVGVLVTALISAGAALLFPSVIDLWYVIGTLFIPALLLPLTGAYYPALRLKAGETFVAMLAGFLSSFIAFLAGQVSAVDGAPVYSLGIEPMYVGLAVSSLLYVGGLLRARRWRK